MKMRKRIAAIILMLVVLFNQSSAYVFAQEVRTSIQSVVVTPQHVSSEGGVVTLNITGSGLAENNWKIDIHTYNEYGISMNDRLKATVIEQTLQGASIMIPENTMKNAMEYVIKVSTDGSVQAEMKVTQDAMQPSYKRAFRKVEMLDARTIVATFDKAVDSEPIDLNKIFIADHGNENSNRRDLTENDVVKVNGKEITIKLADAFAANSLSCLYIQKGAFKATENGTTRVVQMEAPGYWAITSNPSVASITLSDTVLDYNGGSVTATLHGTRLEDAGEIKARIFEAGNIEANKEIAVDVERGANPALRFELPGNTTERPVSYMLLVEVDGVTVNEATVENPAKRSVVTVMPEGTGKDAQVLSAATITGNNKLEGVGDNKNITVVVSKQLGELKTVMTIYGANLDVTRTKVRAIDENGIIWPVYDIPE